MRTKFSPQQYFNFRRESSLKIIEEYRKKYERITDVLRANEQIVSLAHRDFTKLSMSRFGRQSAHCSDQILRALIVMFIEQDAYRKTVIRISDNEFLRHFVGLGSRAMMDYSFLCRAMGVLSEKTLRAMNELLRGWSVDNEKIGGEKLRLDTTCYEVNIHHPTDSSLLWDGFRKLSRILRAAQREFPEYLPRHRFHDKKAKKLSVFIARNAKSKAKGTKRKVKSAYKTLLERTGRIVEVAREAVKALERAGDWQLQSPIDEMRHYVSLVERVIYQAEQRVINGVKLPADKKIYSIFEPHTELIKRGKAGKPVEFGHKVLIAQTEDKFIHHYEVMAKQQNDVELLSPTIEEHKRIFGAAPEMVAGDKGFYESMQQIEQLEKEIQTVSIGKKGRRTCEQYERETSEAFLEGQRFRAGSEGSISVLKRAFNLGLCLFKGFKNLAASVGLAVLCHNLVLLTRL